MKDRAIFLARCGAGGATVATILATISAMNGSWFLWGVNCVLMLICAGCMLVNYRLAGVLGAKRKSPIIKNGTFSVEEHSGQR